MPSLGRSSTSCPVLAFLPGLMAGAAFACQICVPIPTRSAADLLIAADTVVFARENPDKPFSLLASEVLRGELPDPGIDLFLDSQSRRLLSLYPDRHVVCLRDESDPEVLWQRIGIANPDIDSLIRSILLLSTAWAEDPASRFAFFKPLLGHADPFISTLAHLEIGRAPYSRIRTLGDALPRQDLHAFLDDIRMSEWHALYILILSQSGHPEDQARIRQTIEAAAQFSTTLQLPAWATAFIEIDGVEAIDRLDRWYLAETKRDTKELQSILLALSTHANSGPGPLRERIITSYGKLLDRHPEFAPTLVIDLRNWQRSDLTQPIATLLKNPPSSLSLADTLTLHNYVRRAHAPVEGIPAPAAALLPYALAGLILLSIGLSLWRRKVRARK